VASLHNFNDFYYAIGLPIPINAISGDSIRQIESSSAGDVVAETLFAQAVYRHWVERTDQIRCRLFRECLASSEKRDLYDKLRTPIRKLGSPLAVKNCGPGQQESLTVGAGFSVNIANKKTSGQMDTIFSLVKKDDSGKMQPIITNQYSDHPASASRVGSEIAPFEILASGIECRKEDAYRCEHAMIGTCQLTSSSGGQFIFFDSGESGGTHNFDVEIQLVPNSDLP